MYHTIEFSDNMVMDLEIAGQPGRTDHLLIERGCRLMAQVRRYVVETEGGPAEVADLFIADGTASRQVPVACFHVVQ